MNGFAVKVTGELLADEGIQEGDVLMVYPENVLEDGCLYVYQINQFPGNVCAGKLHRLPGLWSFEDSVRERVFTSSEITVLGRVRASSREL